MALMTDFLWGGALSANQTEGSYNKDGRGLTNFDMLPMESCRLKDVVTDQPNFFGK